MDNKQIRVNESFFQDSWLQLSDDTQGTLYFNKMKLATKPNPYWRDLDRIKRDSIDETIEAFEKVKSGQYTNKMVMLITHHIGDEIPTIVGGFIDLANNRMAQGLFRYGPIGKQDHSKYNKVSNSNSRWKRYLETKNSECLLDCFNLLRMEIDYPNKNHIPYDNTYAITYGLSLGIPELYYFLHHIEINHNIIIILACRLIDEFYTPKYVVDAHFTSEDDIYHSEVPTIKG